MSILGQTRLWRDRRAVTAVWLAVATPALMAATSLGIEASRWSLARVELQRAGKAPMKAAIVNESRPAAEAVLSR